ncbi:MAG: hypothetical protein AB7I19_17685, partial [Planctomycetota bacterium]
MFPRATCSLLVALTPALTPAQSPLHRAEGARVRVVTHGFEPATAQAVLELADGAFRVVDRRFLGGAGSEASGEASGVPARRPELHLYREATGYRTATLYRDAKQFQQNLACALLDGTAHVA